MDWSFRLLKGLRSLSVVVRRRRSTRRGEQVGLVAAGRKLSLVERWEGLRRLWLGGVEAGFRRE